MLGNFKPQVISKTKLCAKGHDINSCLIRVSIFDIHVDIEFIGRNN